MRSLRRLAALTLPCALLVACTAAESPDASDSSPSAYSSPSSEASTPSLAPSSSASSGQSATPTTPPDPVSVDALAAVEHQGSRLRLGAVRERTAAYTSYDVTYRATTGTRSFTISGVLNVPTGPGPFPAVVLAHGYIDPAY